jgi:hypothetical protein
MGLKEGAGQRRRSCSELESAGLHNGIPELLTIGGAD